MKPRDDPEVASWLLKAEEDLDTRLYPSSVISGAPAATVWPAVTCT